jgi:hypothetical protein
MRRTLSTAHTSFVAAIRRDSPGTDLPRFVAVLDALIAWSAARPGKLAFRGDATRDDVISFGRVGSKASTWSAQVTLGEGPKLELLSPSDAPLSAEDRAMVMATLNAHSRVVLEEGDRLRIGFGALKNEAGRAAVLGLMEQLLERPKKAPKQTAAPQPQQLTA